MATEATRKFLETKARTLAVRARRLTALSPASVGLRPEDIAPMVAYLCSDEARMITGQAYNVDGGICMA